MSNTKQAILDLGEQLIRTKGYQAFSYKDISETLGIKNAAVHYHFPAKGDLGVAIIQRTISKFKQVDQEWKNLSAKSQLVELIKVYEGSQEKKWACLMGALSSSVESLPDAMQTSLQQMAEIILDRVTKTMQMGLENGEFEFQERPRQKAQLIISALLSSLLLDRVMKENVFDSITSTIIQSVESRK